MKKLIAVTLVLCIGVVYIQLNVYKKSYNKSINSVEVLANINKPKEIDEQKAIKLVKDYLMENNEYLAEYIEVDSIDNKYYIIHVYDIVINGEESHTATTGWYQVNKYSGEIINIMQ
ncbi:MAG: hypothetical protein ACRDA3_04495 [Peptostreptococcaceae bacterium]